MKTRLILLFFFIVRLPFWLSAQPSKPEIQSIAKEDSFRKAISGASADTARLKILFELGMWQAGNRRFAEAEKTSVEIIAGAKEIDSERGQADGQRLSAVILFNQGLFIQAIDKYEQALKIYEKLPGEELLKAGILHKIAICYRNTGNLPQAIKYFNECKITAQRIGKPGNDLHLNALNGLGGTMVSAGEPKKAVAYFTEGAELAKKMGNTSLLPSLYINLSSALSSDPEKAAESLKMLYKSIEAADPKVHHSALGTAYTNLGSKFEAQKNYPQALEYYLKGLKMKIGRNNLSAVAYNLRVIGDLYANGFRQPHQALPYYRQSYDTSLLMQDPGPKYYSACSLAAGLAQSGRHADAYQYLVKAGVYKDSLVSSDKTREMGKLEAQFAYEKQAEIEKAQKQAEVQEQARRNNLQYLIIFVFITSLFTLLIFFGRLKVPFKVMEVVLFMVLLLTFEFLLVLTDPFFDRYSGGLPLYKLAFNTLIAFGYAPLHSYLESVLRKKVILKE